jgi:AraC family transcriptional regulator
MRGRPLGKNCYIAFMTTTTHGLASGPGWAVDDVICTAGPHDRPFEERHDHLCIAAVSEGTFQYRTSQGAALLVPGALLLGNHGQCFECGHEHAKGDRCLSFHFAPEFFESLVADVPGARALEFALPRLPPLQSLMALVAAAEAAREDCDQAEFEELALRLASAVVAALAGSEPEAQRPNARHERRIIAALRRIAVEAHELAHDSLSLAALAREAAMSPFHFLRAFRQIVGMTPHQYILHMRLHHAALRLVRTREPVSAIAFAAGFDDLSTFNRRFRRIMGASPGAFRAGRGRAGGLSGDFAQGFKPALDL